MNRQLALLMDANRARRGRLAHKLSDRNLQTIVESELAEAVHTLSKKRHHALLIHENVARSQLARFCESVRQQDPELVVVASLSKHKARLEERLLDCGIGDVVTDLTPVGAVAKRICRLLHNKGQSDPPRNLIRLGHSLVDLQHLEVWNNGAVQPITRGMSHLLEYFLKNRGQIISRDQICRELWADAVIDPKGKNLDVHVSKLRRLIEVDPKHPKLIKTVYGLGYKMPVRA